MASGVKLFPVALSIYDRVSPQSTPFLAFRDGTLALQALLCRSEITNEAHKEITIMKPLASELVKPQLVLVALELMKELVVSHQQLEALNPSKQCW